MWSSMEQSLDSYFKLTERGTTIGTEFRAGTSSFLTLSYLLLVNPQIMAAAGVAHDDAVFATALSSAVSCWIVGLMANLPFGCAPGLGLSAYLTYGLVVAELCTLGEALTACLTSGILVLVFALSGLTHWLMSVVPQSIKYAIVVGMGLLIAMIGMVSVDMIVSNDKTLVQLGNVWGDVTLQLVLLGMLLVASLVYHDVKGGILIAISFLTILFWTLDNEWPETIFKAPEIHPRTHDFDFSILWDPTKISVIYPAVCSFLLICIFDISGVMFGLATLAGIIEEPTGTIPGSFWPFLASAFGTAIAAVFGSTPIIVCVECASGVKEGGRTGLTACVIGTYFGLALFLSPLFGAVPETATAPVLVLVGVMMMGESAKIPWEHMNDGLPAFLTIILMPLTYSITNGMIFGLLASMGFYFTTGQFWVDLKGQCQTLQRKLRPGAAAAAGTMGTTDEEILPMMNDKSEGTEVTYGSTVY